MLRTVKMDINHKLAELDSIKKQEQSHKQYAESLESALKQYRSTKCVPLDWVI